MVDVWNGKTKEDIIMRASFSDGLGCERTAYELLYIRLRTTFIGIHTKDMFRVESSESTLMLMIDDDENSVQRTQRTKQKTDTTPLDARHTHLFVDLVLFPHIDILINERRR